MKKVLALVALTCIFSLATYSQKYKTIEKSGRRPHWLKWSNGKIYKTSEKARKNQALNKSEEVYFFVVTAEELFYYSDDFGEYGYKLEDVQDELDYNVSKTIAGMVLTNFEESFKRGIEIKDNNKREQVHTKIGELKRSVTISGITPIKEYWEKVVYKDKSNGKIRIKVARQYSINKSYLDGVLKKASKFVGLTKEEANSAKNDFHENVKESTPKERIDENYEW